MYKNTVFFLIILSISIVVSCKPKTSKQQEETVLQQDHILLGSYVGYFGAQSNANKITILISQIKGDTLEGRSIVGGNDRPFTGTFTENDSSFLANAKEPGDHLYDGAFSFVLKKELPGTLSGSWVPFKNSTTPKEFALNRKKFKYDPNNGIFPEASLRLLKTEEVENQLKVHLVHMRNEIFARHGYCFKQKDLRDLFEGFEWYVPQTTDIKLNLTDIEKKNIELIKRYEKYAIDFGDAYGR